MRIRRLIVAVVALVAALSGVGAVSAFEAHTINVKAHVENALSVAGPATRLLPEGHIVFPQEFFKDHFTIALSTSFQAVGQTRVNAVNYKVYGECKPKVENNGREKWALGLWIGVEAASQRGVETTPGSGIWNLGTLTSVGDATGVGGSAPTTYANATDDCAAANVVKLISGPHSLNLAYGPAVGGTTEDLSDTLAIAWDIPVFGGSYNAGTDVAVKPSSMGKPTAIIGSADHRHAPLVGVDMGLDIKVQVVCIGNNSNVSLGGVPITADDCALSGEG